jgi:hypothetical protein
MGLQGKPRDALWRGVCVYAGLGRLSAGHVGLPLVLKYITRCGQSAKDVLGSEEIPVGTRVCGSVRLCVCVPVWSCSVLEAQ